MQRPHMFGRQNIDIGLYYDPASRRFFGDMGEYDRRFRWDTKLYSEALPLPPQLVAEQENSEEENFGSIDEEE